MVESDARGRASARRLDDSLDRAALANLCETTADKRKRKKYRDVDRWLAVSWRQANYLGLDRANPIDILDLGLGPGYFLYVCAWLGHRCTGLDVPGDSFSRELRQWLGIENVIETAILAATPLPQMGRFDLVTAYRCQFNYNRTEGRLWTLSEWAFFLDDLRDNVLKPNGRFALNLPKQKQKGRRGGLRHDSDELNAFLSAGGAKRYSDVYSPHCIEQTPAALDLSQSDERKIHIDQEYLMFDPLV